MLETASLESIAQVAITLAGFSGIQMMLRTGPMAGWHPRARFPFWTILAWSLGALVFCYLPSVLAPFGLTEWTVPNFLLAAFLFGAATLTLLQHFRLTRQGAPTQAPIGLGLNLAISYVGAVIVLASGLGLLTSPGAGWYRLGVLACLLSAVPPFLASFRIRDEPAA